MVTKAEAARKRAAARRRKLRQTGTSNRAADKKRKAKHPGKRVSRTGRLYSERRKNRSDKNRTKKL